MSWFSRSGSKKRQKKVDKDEQPVSSPYLGIAAESDSMYNVSEKDGNIDLYRSFPSQEWGAPQETISTCISPKTDLIALETTSAVNYNTSERTYQSSSTAQSAKESDNELHIVPSSPQPVTAQSLDVYNDIETMPPLHDADLRGSIGHNIDHMLIESPMPSVVKDSAQEKHTILHSDPNDLSDTWSERDDNNANDYHCRTPSTQLGIISIEESKLQSATPQVQVINRNGTANTSASSSFRRNVSHGTPSTSSCVVVVEELTNASDISNSDIHRCIWKQTVDTPQAADDLINRINDVEKENMKLGLNLQHVCSENSRMCLKIESLQHKLQEALVNRVITADETILNDIRNPGNSQGWFGGGKSETVNKLKEATLQLTKEFIDYKNNHCTSNDEVRALLLELQQAHEHASEQVRIITNTRAKGECALVIRRVLPLATVQDNMVNNNNNNEENENPAVIPLEVHERMLEAHREELKTLSCQHQDHTNDLRAQVKKLEESLSISVVESKNLMIANMALIEKSGNEEKQSLNREQSNQQQTEEILMLRSKCATLERENILLDNNLVSLREELTNTKNDVAQAVHNQRDAEVKLQFLHVERVKELQERADNAEKALKVTQDVNETVNSEKKEREVEESAALQQSLANISQEMAIYRQAHEKDLSLMAEMELAQKKSVLLMIEKDSTIKELKITIEQERHTYEDGMKELWDAQEMLEKKNEQYELTLADITTKHTNELDVVNEELKQLQMAYDAERALHRTDIEALQVKLAESQVKVADMNLSLLNLQEKYEKSKFEVNCSTEGLHSQSSTVINSEAIPVEEEKETDIRVNELQAKLDEQILYAKELEGKLIDAEQRMGQMDMNTAMSSGDVSLSQHCALEVTVQELRTQIEWKENKYTTMEAKLKQTEEEYQKQLNDREAEINSVLQSNVTLKEKIASLMSDIDLERETSTHLQKTLMTLEDENKSLKDDIRRRDCNDAEVSREKDNIINEMSVELHDAKINMALMVEEHKRLNSELNERREHHHNNINNNINSNSNNGSRIPCGDNVATEGLLMGVSSIAPTGRKITYEEGEDDINDNNPYLLEDHCSKISSSELRTLFNNLQAMKQENDKKRFEITRLHKEITSLRSTAANNHCSHVIIGGPRQQHTTSNSNINNSNNNNPIIVATNEELSLFPRDTDAITTLDSTKSIQKKFKDLLQQKIRNETISKKKISQLEKNNHDLKMLNYELRSTVKRLEHQISKPLEGINLARGQATNHSCTINEEQIVNIVANGRLSDNDEGSNASKDPHMSDSYLVTSANYCSGNTSTVVDNTYKEVKTHKTTVASVVSAGEYSSLRNIADLLYSENHKLLESFANQERDYREMLGDLSEELEKMRELHSDMIMNSDYQEKERHLDGLTVRNTDSLTGRTTTYSEEESAIILTLEKENELKDNVISSLKTANESLETEKAASMKLIAQLEDRLVNKDAHRCNSDSNNDNINDNNNNDNCAVDGLKGVTSEVPPDPITPRVITVVEDIEDLKAQLGNSQEEIKSLLKQVETWKNNVDDINSALYEKENEYMSLKEEQDSLQEEIQRLKRNEEKMKEKHASELMDLSNEITLLQTNAASFKADTNTIIELEKSNKALTEAESHIKELLCEIEGLNVKLREMGENPQQSKVEFNIVEKSTRLSERFNKQEEEEEDVSNGETILPKSITSPKRGLADDILAQRSGEQDSLALEKTSAQQRKERVIIVKNQNKECNSPGSINDAEGIFNLDKSKDSYDTVDNEDLRVLREENAILVENNEKLTEQLEKAKLECYELLQEFNTAIKEEKETNESALVQLRSCTTSVVPLPSVDKETETEELPHSSSVQDSIIDNSEDTKLQPIIQELITVKSSLVEYIAIADRLGIPNPLPVAGTAAADKFDRMAKIRLSAIELLDMADNVKPHMYCSGSAARGRGPYIEDKEGHVYTRSVSAPSGKIGVLKMSKSKYNTDETTSPSLKHRSNQKTETSSVKSAKSVTIVTPSDSHNSNKHKKKRKREQRQREAQRDVHGLQHTVPQSDHTSNTLLPLATTVAIEVRERSGMDDIEVYSDVSDIVFSSDECITTGEINDKVLSKMSDVISPNNGNINNNNNITDVPQKEVKSANERHTISTDKSNTKKKETAETIDKCIVKSGDSNRRINSLKSRWKH